MSNIKSDCAQELEALKKYYEYLLAKAKSDCKKELDNLKKLYEDLLAKGDGDTIEKRITSSELETYEIKPGKFYINNELIIFCNLLIIYVNEGKVLCNLPS